MIDTSTTEGKIAVMQAFADGKKIQYRYRNNPEWLSVSVPSWDWCLYVYRVYGEPVIPDEIPWEAVDPKFKYHFFNKQGHGFFMSECPTLSPEGFWDIRLGRFASSVLFVIKRGNQPWDKSLVKRPKDV